MSTDSVFAGAGRATGVAGVGLVFCELETLRLSSSAPLLSFMTTLPAGFVGKMSDIRGGTGKLEKLVAGDLEDWSPTVGRGTCNAASVLFEGGKSKAGGSVRGGGNRRFGIEVLDELDDNGIDDEGIAPP